MENLFSHDYHHPRYRHSCYEDEKVMIMCYLYNKDCYTDKITLPLEASLNLVKDYITQYSVTHSYASDTYLLHTCLHILDLQLLAAELASMMHGLYNIDVSVF